MKSRIITLLTILVGLLCRPELYAATIDRPLPVANLNSAAGANRSNVAVAEIDLVTGLPGTAIVGDYVRMPVSPQNGWIITAIQTWSVASVLGEPLGAEFSDVSLYGRVRGEELMLLASGTPDTFFDPVLTNVVRNSNPNILHRNVTYVNGEPYESVGGGTFFPIWEHTFTGLNIPVFELALFEFAVNGTGAAVDPLSQYGYWFTHMSNAALSGNIQESVDGEYLIFDLMAPGNPAFERNLETSQLWDKRADVNVRVFITAAEVPEPGTYALVGAGLTAAWLLRRRVSKNV
jgi:hypothetical protein